MSAEAFRRLHHGKRILVLPNAWDAASARIFEEAGFPAMATTSGGIAFSLGCPDGEQVPFKDMAAAVRRIACAVRVPVSADIEAGHGNVARTVQAIVRAGAVGINLEDARDGRLYDLPEQVDRIRQARKAGGRIVINARVDGFLSGQLSFEETVDRCRAYRNAGADCVFVLGARDARTLRALVLTVGGPLNVIAGPGVPTVPKLQALGVARVSIGSGTMRSTMGLVRRIARELIDRGTYGALLDGAVPYAEANRLFRR